MIDKFYKILTFVCGLLGQIGTRIQNWAEYNEWNYWNSEQFKIIDLPQGVKVFIHYNNKGDYVEVSLNYWPMIDGRYDWDRPEVMRQRFTREQILQIATKEDVE